MKYYAEFSSFEIIQRKMEWAEMGSRLAPSLRTLPLASSIILSLSLSLSGGLPLAHAYDAMRQMQIFDGKSESHFLVDVI